MNPHLSVSQTALAAFRQEHGIRRLAVYGSALRDDFGPDSDIDLLVEFEPDRIPGLLGVAGMEITLSELFAGRKFNVREHDINRLRHMIEAARSFRFCGARCGP